VARVVDLTATGTLDAVGLNSHDLTGDNLTACQNVGGAAAWLDYGGLLVPSVRRPGTNLVVLVGVSGFADDLTVVSSRGIDSS